MTSKAKDKINEVIFTAVDSIYFKKYAYVWAWSIYQNNLHGHIHVINPSNRDINNLKKLRITSKGKINFSVGDFDFSLPKDKCYFASFRFLYIEKLKELYNKVLITDVDSIIRKRINFPKEDFGFFIREPLDSRDQWYVESSKLAAGIFYINLDSTKNFNFKDAYLDNLLHLRKQNQWKWMVDQHALHKIFLELEKFNEFEIKKFNSIDLCWDFKQPSIIWTGKGKRKHKSTKYLREYKKYLHEYQKTSKMSLADRLLTFVNQL
jgi:hypothetical protein